MTEANYIAHSGDDLLVVNAARVSFKKRSALEFGALKEADRRLIAYLASHGHWTPFAHPQITIHCKAPIFVRTQAFKHKVGFVENEVSRRYVDDAPEFAQFGWRGRADDKKQGSGAHLEQAAAFQAFTTYNDALTSAQHAYDSLLAQGIAPEQARAVLPQSMMTEWFWTGSLAAWARFVKQRTDPHAQAETAALATACAEIIQPLFPVCWAVLV